MTSSNNAQLSTATKQESRRLKVYYAFSNNRFGRNHHYPVIRIAGKYLSEFGFEIGTRFQLDLTDGQIIIQKVSA